MRVLVCGDRNWGKRQEEVDLLNKTDKKKYPIVK